MTPDFKLEIAAREEEEDVSASAADEVSQQAMEDFLQYVQYATGAEEPKLPTETNGPGNRSGLLQEAGSCVNGDRNVDYGDPIEDFRRTADMWSAYLGNGVHLQPHDVAAMMSMLKLSRIRWSPGKRDHWVDLAGYAACGYDCSVREGY